MAAARMVTPDTVPDDARVLRASFKAGATKPRAWRARNLRAMLRMLREGRPRLVAALQADMHKNRIEAYFTEINFAETEAQHMLDHLDEYMAPEKVATDILNVPGPSTLA